MANSSGTLDLISTTTTTSNLNYARFIATLKRPYSLRGTHFEVGGSRGCGRVVKKDDQSEIINLSETNNLGGRPIKVYSLMQSFFNELAPTWRKTQITNLTILANALLSRKTLCTADLARAYPKGCKRKAPHPKHGLWHRLKRLRRFLSNPRPDLEAVFVRLTRLSHSVCRSPGQLLPVLLDPTYFGDYTTLVASVPRSGRALPICWRVFRRDLDGEIELSQNHIVQAMVREVVSRLTESIQMVLVADREFAAAAFFRFIKGLKKDFTIRVDAETWMMHKDYQGPFGELPVRRGGRRLWFVGALYGKEERQPVNILAVWQANQKEPWFIATTLDDPKLVERLYRKRMKIEHGFRDWKHHLRLKGTLRVKSADRAGRLITALALLYWFICLTGTRLNHPRHQVEVSYWGKASLFMVAFEMLQAADVAAVRAAEKVIGWVQDKLFGLKPLSPKHKRRYLRFRLCSLPQSGSP